MEDQGNTPTSLNKSIECDIDEAMLQITTESVENAFNYSQILEAVRKATKQIEDQD